MKIPKIILFIAISLLFTINCAGKDFLKESSYINTQSSAYGIYEVKFPSSKTIELLGKGKYSFSNNKQTYWKEKIEYNKKDNNFFVYDEFGDILNIGYFSPDMEKLYIGDQINHIDIFEKENSVDDESIYGQTYIAHFSYGFSTKIKINKNGIVEKKLWKDEEGEPEDWENKGKIELDETKHNFTLKFKYDDDLNYNENGKYLRNDGMGIISDNFEKLYFYDCTEGYIFTKNKIFVDSFKIDELSFETKLVDFQILYPQAELTKKTIAKETGETERQYCISDFTDYGYTKTTYIFYDDKLHSIEKYLEDEEASRNIKKSLQELTNKYGKPKVIDYFDVDPYTTIYVWNGEIVITYMYTKPHYGYEESLSIIYQTKKDEKGNVNNF